MSNNELIITHLDYNNIEHRKAAANLHIKLEYGQEPHHIAEAIFKGFGRALDISTSIDSRQANKLPSTKGRLD